jgi:hypothetical protein
VSIKKKSEQEKLSRHDDDQGMMMLLRLQKGDTQLSKHYTQWYS